MAHCTDSLDHVDLAHDVGASEDTIRYVLNGKVWPNLQLLLTLLTSLDCQLVGYRRTDA